jgi:hypothetical protein
VSSSLHFMNQMLMSNTITVPAQEHFLFDENLPSYPTEFHAWANSTSEAFRELVNDLKLTRSQTGRFLRALSSTTGVHVDAFAKFLEALVVCACGNYFTLRGWNLHVNKTEKHRWVCGLYPTSVGEH